MTIEFSKKCFNNFSKLDQDISYENYINVFPKIRESMYGSRHHTAIHKSDLWLEVEALGRPRILNVLPFIRDLPEPYLSHRT